jgi:hypothetical protein
MSFTLLESTVYYNEKRFKGFDSVEEAKENLTLLEVAYNEGRRYEVREQDRLKNEVRESRWKHNFRWVLHVTLVLSVFGMVLLFTAMPINWVFFGLVSLLILSGSLYGLGRIDRVTF